MSDERPHKPALARLLKAADALQRAEGVTVDGAALRELCRQVERGEVDEQAARERLLLLGLPDDALEC